MWSPTGPVKSEGVLPLHTSQEKSPRKKVTMILFYKIKPLLYSQYYIVACSEMHLRSLAPGQRSSEETSQRWRVVGDTVSNLTTPGIESQTSCTAGVVFTQHACSCREFHDVLTFRVIFVVTRLQCRIFEITTSQ